MLTNVPKPNAICPPAKVSTTHRQSDYSQSMLDLVSAREFQILEYILYAFVHLRSRVDSWILLQTLSAEPVLNVTFSSSLTYILSTEVLEPWT